MESRNTESMRCATSMEGGLGLPVKMVQERMGHSSITLTAKLYSHLFPSDDDGSEMKDAEKALLPV